MKEKTDWVDSALSWVVLEMLQYNIYLYQNRRFSLAALLYLEPNVPSVWYDLHTSYGDTSCYCSLANRAEKAQN